MKIEEIVEIILELPFEIESEEVAKEFITEVKKEYGGVLPITNTFNIHNSFVWSKSNLGFEFWSELHEKILDYLVGSILQHPYQQQQQYQLTSQYLPKTFQILKYNDY